MVTVFTVADDRVKLVVLLVNELDPSDIVGRDKLNEVGDALDVLTGVRGPGVTVSATFVFFLQ